MVGLYNFLEMSKKFLPRVRVRNSTLVNKNKAKHKNSVSTFCCQLSFSFGEFFYHQLSALSVACDWLGLSCRLESLNLGELYRHKHNLTVTSIINQPLFESLS
jgi:hypothetical protein